MRVRGDAAPEPVRRLDDGADFLIGELLVDAGAQVGEYAAGGDELYGIRALRDLSPYRSTARVSAVADAYL